MAESISMASTLLYQFGILNAQYEYKGTKIVIIDFGDHANTLTYHLCTISLIIVLCGFYTKAFYQKHNSEESINDKTSRD